MQAIAGGVFLCLNRFQGTIRALRIIKITRKYCDLLNTKYYI
nr:MAG TPA: hypothetical protein [Caudoviricetes sp.]